MGEMLYELLLSTIRLATPLMFAAMGGMLSERSGTINIALEGKMVVGAFTAAVIAFGTGSPWLGFAAGGAAGLLLALLYGVVVIPGRANQIVAGTGINMLAYGIPPFVAKILFDVTGSTPALSLDDRFSYEPMVVIALVVIGLWALLKYTPAGLRLTVSGEHPEALQAAGVRIVMLRWRALMAGGFLAGLGGACLSIALASSYSRNMTAGRGFIALAALILGGWKPVPAALACLFFGLADAVQIRLQGVELPVIGLVPVQFIQILPYVVTLIVLAGFVGKARAPAALGAPLR